MAFDTMQWYYVTLTLWKMFLRQHLYLANWFFVVWFFHVIHCLDNSVSNYWSTEYNITNKSVYQNFLKLMNSKTTAKFKNQLMESWWTQVWEHIKKVYVNSAEILFLLYSVSVCLSNIALISSFDQCSNTRRFT